MNTRTRYLILSLLLALLLLLAFGMYRSHVYQISFAMALYLTTVTIIAELWQFLLNPIVLVALAGYAFLWMIRPHLPMLLAGITELRAGAFSAKIDLSRVLGATLSQIPIKGKTTPAESLSKEALAVVVSNLREGVCWYLLKVANKGLEMEEHFDILRRELRPDQNQNKDGGSIQSLLDYARGSGYWLAIALNLDGTVFKTEKEQEKLILRIAPEALQVITQRLGIAKEEVDREM